MESAVTRDWTVTREKVDEAVRRIVEHADPLRIVAFGSRARGDHREDSDLDLAVIVDAPEETLFRRVPYSLFTGICMHVDLIVVSLDKYERLSPWMNSVCNYIATEGVVLHDREHPERVCAGALHTCEQRHIHSAVPAA